MNEGALPLVILLDTTASTIFSFLKDLLTRYSRQMHQTALDRRLTVHLTWVHGINDEVQALMKEENPKCFYVLFRCRLNLASAKSGTLLWAFEKYHGLHFKLGRIIKLYANRLHCFDRIRKQVAIFTSEVVAPSLRTLCATRWTDGQRAISNILLNN